jgi:hypothetical protein
MNSIIVIPVYKDQLLETEMVSLLQCIKILGNHTICLVAPESLDLSAYDVTGQQVRVERFDAEYFKNISGYNRLLLSLEFYSRFSAFEYMLIYQLDCYVFRDELLFWCEKGYDYIGAPWLFFDKANMTFKENLKLVVKQAYYKYFKKDVQGFQLYHNVGNGGFSLRNIKKFRSVLASGRTFQEFYGNDTKSLGNEDVFWSFAAPGIKKPDYKTASKFALDMNVNIGLRYNNGKLPFGCHAWPKKMQYWKDYIK